MALVARAAGVLPLFGAMATAAILAGVAVLTVSQANCATPGHYVRENGTVRLVGGCVDTTELPPLSLQQAAAAHGGARQSSQP